MSIEGIFMDCIRLRAQVQKKEMKRKKELTKPNKCFILSSEHLFLKKEIKYGEE